MNKKQSDLVLIATKTGVLYGIYERLILVDSKKETLKTLDALTKLWLETRAKASIDRIFYARGPGSLSAIKLLHIFIQTLVVVSEIKAFAVDSFYFNKKGIIHAFGNQYFQKDEKGQIILAATATQVSDDDFVLPQALNPQDFNQSLEPLYVVPPV